MQLNILGEPLLPCCMDPLTGWQRDGLCGFYPDDSGLHLVCIEATEEFLEFSREAGNDLSTASDYFPGLKPGDKWCLCTARWLQALKEDKAPRIYLKATSIEVVKYIPLPLLKQMACDV